jgi:hypothetical protein
MLQCEQHILAATPMTTDFESHIAGLVERYLGPRDPDMCISPLTAALGIRQIYFSARGWMFSDRSEPPPGVDLSKHEPLLCRTMQHALRSHRSYGPHHFSNSVAITTGLLENKRWRQCLSDSQSSYDLAEHLLGVVSVARISVTMSVRSVLDPLLCNMLNEWLMPAEPYVEPPSKATLARAMFGDVWCDLMTNGDDAYDPRWQEIISTYRPVFLPGLVMFSQDTCAIALPGLDCAP